MDEIKILTEGDSSVLIEFGKEISPQINGRITTLVRMIKGQQIEGVTAGGPVKAGCGIHPVGHTDF